MRATTVLPPPWLNTADAEIKVPFAGNSELSNVILVCIWSGSECMAKDASPAAAAFLIK